jgi:hypothetical protein
MHKHSLQKIVLNPKHATKTKKQKFIDESQKGLGA